MGAASLPARWQRPLALIASLVLPFVAVGFAFSSSFALSCLLLVAVGGWITALETLVNSLVLVEVKDEFRGRVISLFTAVAMGAPRIGGLQAGWLAEWSAPLALAVGSATARFHSLPRNLSSGGLEARDHRYRMGQEGRWDGVVYRRNAKISRWVPFTILVIILSYQLKIED